MENINLKIEGMSCQHCVSSVRKAVDTITGIKLSDISVGSATIDYDESLTDREEIVKAVQSAGFRVETISQKQLE